MNPSGLLWLTVALLLLPLAVIPPARRSEFPTLARWLWWLNLIYCRVWHRLQVANACTVPDHGPAIVIANHTCNIDHMLIQAGCPRLLGFMVAEEYYQQPWIKPFCILIGCIPVRRDGRDMAATRVALRALAEGRVLPLFPEGRILPQSGDGLYPFQAGAAYLALKSNAAVVPVYISGTPKSNILWKSFAYRSHARILFGPPIRLDDMNGLGERERLEQAHQRLRAAIESLQAQPREP